MIQSKRLSLISGALLAATLMASPSLLAQQTTKSEKAAHPRIAKAIRELDDAIRYMEAAPHDFGGNKAAALADSRKAVESLRKALAYRAAQDNKGKK